MDAPMIGGVIGMILILIGFFMVQSHRWSQDDTVYDVVNCVGSVLLVWYGVAGKVWPFVILNSVWALYSLKDVMGDLRNKTR